MDKLKEHFWSLLKTFLSGLGSAIVLAIGVLPDGTVYTLEFWKGGGALALLTAAIRSALKVVWDKAPVSFGGKK